MEKLKRKEEVYWDVDEKENPVGDPYCPRCYEVDNLKVHLIKAPNPDYKRCPQCKFNIKLIL